MLTIPRITSADELQSRALKLTLSHAPWSEQFPYKPEVNLHLAHDGRNMLFEWHVSEDCIRAEAQADGGHVWEDSCVECFLQLPRSSLPLGSAKNSSTPQLPNSPTPYYNIECNCAGRLLVGYGPDRHHRELLPAEVMAAITREPSLGSEPRPLTDGHCEWTLGLSVPLATFIHDAMPTLSGMQARANFYKCGDCLTRPHFLTAFPIRLPKPDFHCPQFFQPIVFE